jgi:hypothetical protein
MFPRPFCLHLVKHGGFCYFFFIFFQYEAINNKNHRTINHDTNTTKIVSYRLRQKIKAFNLVRAVGKKPAAKSLDYHVSLIRKWCKAEYLRAYANIRGEVPTERVRLNGSRRNPIINNKIEEA